MIAWNEIMAKCPKLYPKGMYFECLPGWQSIIGGLSFQIENILKKSGETDMYAVQVKQKYGTLRFYMSKVTPEIADLISDTEALSSQRCELCGHFGKMRGAHHIVVRCDKCFKENHG